MRSPSSKTLLRRSNPAAAKPSGREDRNMPKELRVGMISWAHVHAEFRAKALKELPGARIVAISDDNEARGRAAAKRFGVDQFVADWRKLVRRDDIDVVMVHSENSRHVDQVIAAA